MQRTLVAFDTDRIKGYVFGTDKLKEVRGASAILDRLNREDMLKFAKELDPQCEPIYANGGSGLFLVNADEEKAKEFGRRVQQRYREETKGGASITYVIQVIPEGAPQEKEALMKADLSKTLELLRYKMRMDKDCPSEVTVLPSHPFMQPCTSCGVNYAEEQFSDPNDGTTGFYCLSCRAKQKEDRDIKDRILPATISYIKYPKKISSKDIMANRLWNRVIYQLKEDSYSFPQKQMPERPSDFNVFRDLSKSKEYLGLIYADGNNMGVKIDGLKTLEEIQRFSLEVDNTIHLAMSAAIQHSLQFKDGDPPLFPFDILLLGGDDLMIVTNASKAMDVALMIATKFRELSGKKFTLSVGVVLAPVKYPFSLLQDLAEQTLKAAKKASWQARNDEKKKNKDAGNEQKVSETFDDTRISFLLIAGSSVHSYKHAMDELGTETDINRDEGKKSEQEFHATLRPYDPLTLQTLLDAIYQANTSGINRSKLHQMREAILKMNLTTSVSESIATLRNWQPKQRELVVTQFYKIGSKPQDTQQKEQNPFSDFPRVTFPWFWDGQNEEKEDIYRTSILDFIELYDFVSRED